MMNNNPDQFRLFYSVSMPVLLHYKDEKEWGGYDIYCTFKKLIRQCAPDAFNLQRAPSAEALPMADYLGSKEHIDQAAISLSSIVHRETRQRLFDVTTHMEGTNYHYLQSASDYVPQNDLILPVPHYQL